MSYTQHMIFFQIVQDREQSFGFEQGLQILFGLRGEARVICGSREYRLEPAGLLVINPFELFRISAPDHAALLCLRISRQMLTLAGWNGQQQYACYARGSGGGAEYDQLRRLLASVFRVSFQGAGHESAGPAVEAMQLIGLLHAKFSVRSAAQPQKEADLDRVKRVLDTIHEHWNEDLSLSHIATEEYLSTSYLSRFFKRYLRMTYSQYVRELRLRHACHMLTNSSLSVVRIAYECGFHNASAFIEAFKSTYHQTPGEFRQFRQEEGPASSQPEPGQEPGGELEPLLSYAPEMRETEPPSVIRRIDASCAGAGKPLRHTWRRLLNIGYAHDGLLAPVQEQIRQAHREIGFEYLRFHGLLDEDMRIYGEDASGAPRFDFSRMDLLLDFVRSLGMHLHIEFGFMPSTLAKEQTRIFDRPSVISGCRDLDKWSRLVRAILTHCIDRYGREEVRRWRFSTVSQNYVHLNCILPEDYEALYCTTWRVVKEVDPAFLFGGPGCWSGTVREENGLALFLDFAEKQGCVPDFLTIQHYPHQNVIDDPLFMQFTLSQQSAPSILSGDVDFLAHTLDAAEEVLERHELGGVPLYLEECTSTLWQRVLSSDTCYKAAWIARNFCETCDRAEAVGYWLLTDYMEERASLRHLFHGGYGLFTYNGIPKAGYQALRLLRRLGERRIASGEGWFLTRSGQDYRLLLYNYCHYSNLYRYRYQRLTQPQDAYSVFEPGEVWRLRLRLRDAAPGVYRMTSQVISRQSGSAFDTWLDMGGEDLPKPEEIAYLRQTALPSCRTDTVEAEEGGQMYLETTLHPLEVELISLQYLGPKEEN